MQNVNIKIWDNKTKNLRGSEKQTNHDNETKNISRINYVGVIEKCNEDLFRVAITKVCFSVRHSLVYKKNY